MQNMKTYPNKLNLMVQEISDTKIIYTIMLKLKNDNIRYPSSKDKFSVCLIYVTFSETAGKK